MCFTLSRKRMSFGLFQHEKLLVRRDHSMKIEALKQRLDRNRPMTEALSEVVHAESH
jgi:hypothetical protein